MSNMRMVKYETMIEDINSIIRTKRISDSYFGAIEIGGSSTGNTALALIYDYEKCNEYAKVIMDKSTLLFYTYDYVTIDSWKKAYPTYDAFKDDKRKLEAAKKLVQLCRNAKYDTEGYKFIFWALMILTVDKTDAEEHLALICDFAKMLRITEDEFEDIIQCIKNVYNEGTTKYVFKSKRFQCIMASF